MYNLIIIAVAFPGCPHQALISVEAQDVKPFHSSINPMECTSAIFIIPGCPNQPLKCLNMARTYNAPNHPTISSHLSSAHQAHNGVLFSMRRAIKYRKHCLEMSLNSWVMQCSNLNTMLLCIKTTVFGIVIHTAPGNNTNT